MTEWEAAGAILAGVILLGGAVRALPPIWTAIKAVLRGFVDFLRALKQMKDVFGVVMTEFTPNHGSSLYDVVHRLEFGAEEQRTYSRETRAKIASLKEDAEHLRASNHAIAGNVEAVVSVAASAVAKIDQHTKDDAVSFTEIMGRLDDIDGALAAAKHDLGQFNEVDRLGSEGRIERRHEQITDMNARLEAIHAELKTLNGLTVGQMADADEGRRIEEIPEADRTEAELQHLTETETP